MTTGDGKSFGSLADAYVHRVLEEFDFFFPFSEMFKTTKLVGVYRATRKRTMHANSTRVHQGRLLSNKKVSTAHVTSTNYDDGHESISKVVRLVFVPGQFAAVTTAAGLKDS